MDGWGELCGTNIRGMGSRFSKNYFVGEIRTERCETNIQVSRELGLHKLQISGMVCFIPSAYFTFYICNCSSIFSICRDRSFLY